MKIYIIFGVVSILLLFVYYFLSATTMGHLPLKE